MKTFFTWQVIPTHTGDNLTVGSVCAEMEYVMKKSRKETVRNEKILLIFGLLAAAIVITACCLAGSIRIQAASSTAAYKYYTSIKVQSGDTLWSIASEYMTKDYEDINTYIEEVCSINKISGDEIHSGQYITIPYYTDKIQ